MPYSNAFFISFSLTHLKEEKYVIIAIIAYLCFPSNR